MLTNTTFDFNKLVNIEVNIKINNAVEALFILSSMLTKVVQGVVHF